jgi:hypothetical protein
VVSEASLAFCLVCSAVSEASDFSCSESMFSYDEDEFRDGGAGARLYRLWTCQYLAFWVVRCQWLCTVNTCWRERMHDDAWNLCNMLEGVYGAAKTKVECEAK